MKKYVASRIIDTDATTASHKEQCQTMVLRTRRPVATPKPLNPESIEADPLPVFDALNRMIDRAYGIRSGKTVMFGRALNVAV